LDLLVSGFIGLYNSPEAEVLSSVIECFGCLIKQTDQTEYIDLVLVLKKTLKGLGTELKKTPNGLALGFCQPKGWTPVLTILREGVLSGGVEIKEVAANCIGQAIQMSDEIGLKAHVVNIAGPLIRVLGEKHPAPVKIAAMNALIRLLEKVGIILGCTAIGH
jgi:hypothetical protein